MWLKDKSKKLEGSVLRNKLKLDVKSVECAVDARGWLIVLLKTHTKHRSSEVLKVLIGEEAFKAMKQPAAMNMPTMDYNQCAPSEGHKIQGANGIEIYANSKDTKNDFKIYSGIISNIMNGTAAGTYLGVWNYEDFSSTQDRAQAQRQWVLDDAVQQQVMREDPAAFGIGSGGTDTESDEEDVTAEKRPASFEAQEQPQPKRVRTAAQILGDPSDSMFMFAERCMQIQRNDAAENAALRVKLAEITYTAKTLTEKLQRSEDRELEIEARLQNSEVCRMKMEYRQREIEGEHAKMIDELTKKLQESEKRCEDIVEKNRASQQDTEELLTKVLNDPALLKSLSTAPKPADAAS